MLHQKLKNLIQFFPETVVSCVNGELSLLNHGDFVLSEKMREFLLAESIAANHESVCSFEENDEFFKIKTILNEDLGLLFFISDITDLNMKKKELEQSKHQLANSSKLAALGEMAGGVAHEINNPLQILALSIEQMRLLVAAQKIDAQECDKICDQMESTIDRVNNIVKGMKLISRDGNSDPFEKINIKEIISETLSFCKEKFKNNGVRLVLFEEESNNHFVSGQRVRLSQVFLNLLNNAFDAISKNKTKTIRVNIASNEKTVTLSISDNGPGVPEELINKVFQPFFTTKEIGKGTGLGLSISKGIIEQHQGKFSLDPDHRSKFIIEMPLFEETEE